MRPADSHNFNADPDPASYFNADLEPDLAFHCNAGPEPGPASHFNADLEPDPAFHFNADPNSAPHQSDANQRSLVNRTSRAPFLVPRLHFEPLTLLDPVFHANAESSFQKQCGSMRIRIQICNPALPTPTPPLHSSHNHCHLCHKEQLLW